MSSNPTIDRDFLQKVLASAFVVQRSQMDSQSLSAIVEVGRLITTADLGVDEAMHLIIDRTRKMASTTGVAVGPLIGAQLPLPGLEEDDKSSEASLAPPKDEPPSAADSMDVCFASFRGRTPEEKSSQFRFRDQWTPLLVVLAIAMALLLSWMFVRVTWRGIAHPKGPPLRVTVLPDAAPAQPEEARQAHPSPPPPVPARSRSPEIPFDSLVVYQDGKVIFRLKSPQAHGESSASEPALGSPRKANARLLQQVEPEYPESAKQQHIQGSVVLEAKVDKGGTVQQLTVISGDSMLSTAAFDAVLKWRFKPLVQNGRAVPFHTRIKVNFVLP